jgi:hypothetical protein
MIMPLCYIKPSMILPRLQNKHKMLQQRLPLISPTLCHLPMSAPVATHLYFRTFIPLGPFPYVVPLSAIASLSSFSPQIFMMCRPCARLCSRTQWSPWPRGVLIPVEEDRSRTHPGFCAVDPISTVTNNCKQCLKDHNSSGGQKSKMSFAGLKLRNWIGVVPGACACNPKWRRSGGLCFKASPGK